MMRARGHATWAAVVILAVLVVIGLAWYVGRAASVEGSLLPVAGSVGQLVEPDGPAARLPLPTVESSEGADASLPVPHPPELVEPLAITVIDASGAAVADAVVEVWDPPDRTEAIRAALAQSGLGKTLPGELTEDDLKQVVKFIRHTIPDPSWEPPRLTLRTDFDGRCELLDATLVTVLLASKEGIGTSGLVPAVPAPMTLRLQPVGHVHGVVRDADDWPVTGATVRFELPGAQSGDGGQRTPKPVHTDERGEFDVLVDAGTLGSATAYRGAPEEASSEDVFSVAAGESEDVVLLFADGTISGRVAWDDGEPVQRCDVTARLQRDRHGKSRDDQDRSVTADPDGTFRISGLRPGARYSIDASVMAPAGVRAKRDDVETGASDVDLVLSRKDAAGWSLRGRVTDMTTGVPIKAFEIGITNWSDAHLGRVSVQSTTRHDTQDGRFEVPRLPAKWVVTVQVRAEGYAPAIFGPIWPDEWSERKFEIGHSGTLTVEIAGPGGQLLEGARVLLYDELSIDGFDLGRPERDQQTPKAGRLSWLPLKPGPRWLLVEHAQGRAGPTRVTVPSGREEVVRCQLVTETPEGRMRVVVRDAENRRLQGEEIELERQTTAPTESAGSDLAISRVRTGPSGEGLVDGLLPGVYRVWVVADHWSSMRFVCVEPGGTTEVEFRTERR